ncbi:phasin family protein [Noviherbaspirillum pedocola]|uniref:Phasin family protein n=1 Tax=Noviherbaspirillum pedocola TaxID=2801341 RepID=A0A934T149_9BURK|nr:phasin family protein [Noviherbaspirillum pedocola]MBK4736967.1 phasin family protein [Noviherbaspirillum pedocola]
MFSFQEQISAATKSNLEAQLAMISALTGKTFEGVEKLVELTMNTAKSSLADTTSHARQLLAVKDVQEAFAFHAAQAQPSAEKLMAYGRNLMSIGSALQTEFAKATEAQITEHGRKLSGFVEEIGKNAPAGSENVVAFLKQTIANANAGYEQFTRSTKQAVEAVEANISNAAAQMSQAAGKVGANVNSVVTAKK